MILSCTSCCKEFSNTAALNFHNKKVHGDKPLITSSRHEKKTTSQLQRVRPTMIKFGNIPGMPDYTKGPFKISRFVIPQKLTEEEADGIKFETSKNCEPVPLKDDKLIVEKTRPDNLPSKRKSNSDVASSENEGVTPLRISTPDPEMPILTPQVISSLVIASPVGRPGPKRSKKGKHWKYNEEHYEMGTSTATSRKSSETVASDSSLCSSTGSRTRYVATWVKSVNDEANAGKDHQNQSNESPSKTNVTSVDNSISKGPSSNSSTSLVFEDDGSIKSSVSKTGDNRNQCTSNGQNEESSSIEGLEIKGLPKYSGNSQECPICRQTGFRTHGQFTNHLEIHEGKRPYVCPICTIGYETEVKLLEHVSIRHCQEAKFACPKCGVNYKVQRALENHKCLQDA